ncbi:MAG: response regulator transcription factor [Planctomycetes bacterium]|nr:response regulator transcription factor [Planctomycetota bacterium]MBL7040551.1 response regulator transcription factor [Pirellulaceae bacterium]
MHKPAILIIGRDGRFPQSLETRLFRSGCEVLTASTGKQGVKRALDALPDAVVLGYDIPDMDSLDICGQIRGHLPPQKVPVFLLTPNHGDDHPANAASPASESVDREWLSIELGMNALQSCTKGNANGDERISTQGLEMDWHRHRATIDGRRLDLTPTEFRLLWALAGEPGKVFDRRLLKSECANGGSRGQVRTIDVHIKAIRGKLSERSTLIETVHGIGYRFREPVSVYEEALSPRS